MLRQAGLLELDGETPLAVSGSQLGSIVSGGGGDDFSAACAAYASDLAAAQRQIEQSLASGQLGQAAAFGRQKQSLQRQEEELAAREEYALASAAAARSRLQVSVYVCW